jgi:hypothetical protein
VFCSVVLALLLLLVAALSAVAVATGRFQFWTYLQGTDIQPTYVLRCAPGPPMHRPGRHGVKLLLTLPQAMALHTLGMPATKALLHKHCCYQGWRQP